MFYEHTEATLTCIVTNRHKHLSGEEMLRTALGKMS